MRGALLIDAYQDWECPECGLEQRSRPVPPNGTRFHVCPKLHNISAPLVRAGADCSLTAVERMDYLGTEVQETGDDGVPYMNVTTRYADGHNDVAVHAPVARARFSID